MWRVVEGGLGGAVQLVVVEGELLRVLVVVLG